MVPVLIFCVLPALGIVTTAPAAILLIRTLANRRPALSSRDVWRQRLARLLTWRRARRVGMVLIALYLVAWIDVWRTGTPPLNSVGAPIGGRLHRLSHRGTADRPRAGAPRCTTTRTVVSVQDGLLGGAIPNFYDAYRNPPFFALAYLPLVGLDLLPGVRRVVRNQPGAAWVAI